MSLESAELRSLTCLHCGREFGAERREGGTPGLCSPECRAARRRQKEVEHRRRRKLGQVVPRPRREPPPAARDHEHEWERMRYRTSSNILWQRHRCAICGHMRYLEWAGSEEYQAEQAHHVGRLASR